MKKWLCTDLPVTPYEEALKIQRRIVAARNGKRFEKDVLLMLEHRPVFTLGRRGGLENLTVSRDFLGKSGIPVVQVERGGNITYHGPGQLVGYPIIDLKTAGLKVVDYVTGLEDVMIRIAADWGVPAGRNPLNRGVWVGSEKLGSVGITIRRGVCFHGFALNVNLSLDPFQWINPCGLSGICVTSMDRQLAGGVSMDDIRLSARKQIASVFKVDLIDTGLDELKKMLDSGNQGL